MGKLLNKKTTLNLTWFGGEPTIASNKIIEFMNKLNKIKNLLLSSNIVTNGYLLNKKLFKKMLDSGISAYQVTLDGNKNNHDKLRVLKNGEPTFEHIYNNILDISKNIKEDFSFFIRGNFLKDNINSMEKLISKFNKDFQDDDRFNIYFRPVDDYDTKDFSKDKNLNSNICNINSGLDIQEKLSSKIKKNDSKEMRIFDSLPQPTYSWCDVERNNHYIFGADGLIYVCDTFIGNKEKSKGKITPEGKLILNEKIKKWRTSIFNEDKNNLTQNCYDCKILPICMGGCRRVRILNNHSACYWTPKRILNRMEKYEKTI